MQQTKHYWHPTSQTTKQSYFSPNKSKVYFGLQSFIPNIFQSKIRYRIFFPIPLLESFPHIHFNVGKVNINEKLFFGISVFWMKIFQLCCSFLLWKVRFCDGLEFFRVGNLNHCYFLILKLISILWREFLDASDFKIEATFGIFTKIW